MCHTLGLNEGNRKILRIKNQQILHFSSVSVLLCFALPFAKALSYFANEPAILEREFEIEEGASKEISKKYINNNFYFKIFQIMNYLRSIESLYC